VAQIYTARRYEKLGQAFEKAETLEIVHAALASVKHAEAQEIARAAKLNPITVERCCLWLVKYGLARYLPDTEH
jgi:DNA-binding IclR family transcriptional regulator